jgi:hypothetical protein
MRLRIHTPSSNNKIKDAIPGGGRQESTAVPSLFMKPKEITKEIRKIAEDTDKLTHATFTDINFPTRSERKDFAIIISLWLSRLQTQILEDA